MSYSKQIKAIRAVIGSTQQKLAEHIGVHVSSIKKWESGDRIPRADHWDKIKQMAEKVGYRIEERSKCDGVFHLPITPVSPTAHWTETQQWEKECQEEVGKIGIGKNKNKRKFIRIDAVVRRTMTMDNLVSTMEPLLRALSDAKVIVSTSPDWVIVEYHQEPRRGRDCGVCLTIQDL